jgi:hypothetical protein
MPGKTKQEQQPDPRVTKRRVTMKGLGFDSEGGTTMSEIVDYVLPEHLAAYTAARRAAGFYVTVSDTPDAGPGGYDGATYVPHDIDHPEAGTFRPATGESHHPADPAHPDNDGVSLNNPWATARHLGVPLEQLTDHPKVAARLASLRAQQEDGK